MESAKRKLLENPCENANLVSRLFLFWTTSMFQKGYYKPLDAEDIIEPLDEDRSKLLGEHMYRVWTDHLNKTKRPSLLKTIFKSFWKLHLSLAIIAFIYDVLVRACLPIFLGQLLIYFRKDSDMTHQEAMKYAAGIAVVTLVNAMAVNHFYLLSANMGLKTRVAICSLIYKKVLRLSQTALGDTAPGKVVNLLSNDMNRFDVAIKAMNALWTSPTIAIISTYLLWYEAQWAGLIGVTIFVIVIFIQLCGAKYAPKFRYQTAVQTDERVRFMDEIICGIQVIKMYAWERPFTNLIILARKLEMKVILKYTYIRALYMIFMLSTARTAIFCTIVSIILLQGKENVTVSKIFVISALYSNIAYTMAQTFVRALTEISEVLVAIKRLQKFLEHDEKQPVPFLNVLCDLNENLAKDQKTIPTENIAVSLKGVSAQWGHVCRDTINGPTLNNLNIEIQKEKLIGIVGRVGAGKSSLLQVLLRELPVQWGTINVNGTLSYAGQEPWVFSSTVRQNIIFGQPFNRDRYEKVIRACDLLKDFKQFQDGDETIIGERGTSLSGGQKARINLGRAMYREADIYLMDDPLSAVDAHVGLHLFEKCIGPNSLLRREHATRILVTHQVHFLKDADWIIILKDGQVELQGTYSDVSESNDNFACLLTEHEVTKPAEAELHSNTERRVKMDQSALISAGNNKEKNEDRKEIKARVQELESTSRGKVQGSLFLKYFRSGANPAVLLLLFSFFLAAQILASSADYFVSFWTHQEELREYYRNKTISEPLMLTAANDTIQENHIDLLSSETCAYIHGSILLFLLLIAVIRTLMFYRVCIIASKNLHNNMFKSIIGTPMRFFDLNPSGRLLNRFTKDMGCTDENLPKETLDATQLNLIMLGVVSVVVIVNPVFLFPLGALAIIFAFLRQVFLRSSKNVKRLEGMAKSPVFTHISATLNGLSTIRALNAQQILMDEFDNHQDTHSACWYMYMSMQAAFGLSLDFLCLIFISSILFVFVLFDTGVTGDKVALAITQALNLTKLLRFGVRQSAEVQNQLTAVERILEYSSLKPEREPEKAIELPSGWPINGKLEFRNVFYRYHKEAEPVLHGLSFVIQPKEKIGIVGRTGAGKSSLICAIFRLAEVEGEILIDDIDTAKVKLSDLRSKIAIIPQDPVLFSGSLRRNLDPFDEYKDDQLWSALEDVELKDICGSAGLQSPVLARGSNFSVGQRQLLCLARAILRGNRILVMDEATANVDPQTDLLIQQTIRRKFEECTVLTVAHRLNTIIDSDRVLVMEAGEAIEFDTSYNLLADDKTIFAGMVTALGASEFARLLKISKDMHDKKYL